MSVTDSRDPWPRRSNFWPWFWVIIIGSVVAVVTIAGMGLYAMSSRVGTPLVDYQGSDTDWGTLYVPTCDGEKVSDVWVTVVLKQPNAQPAKVFHIVNPAPGSGHHIDLAAALAAQPTPTSSDVLIPAVNTPCSSTPTVTQTGSAPIAL